MPHFPVSHSNLSAQHLGEYLQGLYAFHGKVSCKLIRSGINDTYLLEDGEQKSTFRVYSLNWRTKTEIEEEIRLLLMLQAAGIPVSFPIKALNGQFIHRLDAPEGLRLGLLFSFAEGEKLHQVSAEVHGKIGAWMGKMHIASEGFQLDRISYSAESLLLGPLQKIAAFLSVDSQEMAYLVSLQQYLIAQLEAADLSLLRKGAVHLDVWIDNMNVTKTGKITLFDFDFCGNGWLCLDIAYYVMQLHNIERDPAELAPKLAAFLEGYESVVPISHEERRLLPMLGLSLYFFYLGIQCERFENWSNSFLSEAYLKRYIQQLVKRYAELNGIFVEAQGQ